jgi:hypothetical protein
MRLLDIAGYVEDVMPTLRPEELSGITEENDPLGIRNALLLFRAKITSGHTLNVLPTTQRNSCRGPYIHGRGNVRPT